MDPILDELRFDVFTLNADGHIHFLFRNVSLNVAEILSGEERDYFDKAIMCQGWVGTTPAWTSFRPVVMMPHGELLRHEQFKFIIELTG